MVMDMLVAICLFPKNIILSLSDKLRAHLSSYSLHLFRPFCILVKLAENDKSGVLICFFWGSCLGFHLGMHQPLTGVLFCTGNRSYVYQQLLSLRQGSDCQINLSLGLDDSVLPGLKYLQPLSSMPIFEDTLIVLEFSLLRKPGQFISLLIHWRNDRDLQATPSLNYCLWSQVLTSLCTHKSFHFQLSWKGWKLSKPPLDQRPLFAPVPDLSPWPISPHFSPPRSSCSFGRAHSGDAPCSGPHEA